MKIIAVGGYNAVGGNMTGVELNGERIAIDSGIRLDTLQMYDSDTQRLRKFDRENLIKKRIIPNFHIIDNKNLRGIIISHGHLDHIGALSIIKPRVPLYTLPYNAELGRKEFPEGKFQLRNYREEFSLSKEISAEFIEITHSIPYTSLVILHTPEGNIAYASDFRLDNYSQIAKTDYGRLKELDKEGGVKAIIIESLRVGKLGKTPSEKTVKDKLKNLLEFVDSGLIIATTFSSHIERIQYFLDEAKRLNRKVLMLGRSLHFHTKIGEKFGLLSLSEDTKVFANAKGINNALKEIKKRREEYFLIVTGHQGEPDSVLSRMSNGKFDFSFQKGDAVIFGASTIPTPINIATRYAIETKLKFNKVKIFEAHAHGHASKEDHRYLLNLLKPEHIIPCHGTPEMISDYVDLGIEEGYELNKNIHMLSDGLSVEI
jgi:ribonuclease J